MSEGSNPDFYKLWMSKHVLQLYHQMPLNIESGVDRRAYAARSVGLLTSPIPQGWRATKDRGAVGAD
jgi:hypothetical protein